MSSSGDRFAEFEEQRRQRAVHEAARTASDVFALLLFGDEECNTAIMPRDFHAAFVSLPRVDPFWA
jgi:hypothetical protein